VRLEQPGSRDWDRGSAAAEELAERLSEASELCDDRQSTRGPGLSVPVPAIRYAKALVQLCALCGYETRRGPAILCAARQARR
jgi:hypothetical protein